jgi:hypothetical protein
MTVSHWNDDWLFITSLLMEMFDLISCGKNFEEEINGILENVHEMLI